MSMSFTVTLSGDITISGLDASSDLGYVDVEPIVEGNTYFEDGVRVFDASIIEATVTVEARVEQENVEVEASDLNDFDADSALEEATGWTGTITGATFDITDSPTGFELVEAAIGRDSAIEVYGVLASNDYEVF